MHWEFTLTNLLLMIIAIALVVLTIMQIVWRRMHTSEIPNRHQPNLYAALRDVLIASMQKGQLPVAIFGIILIILFLRMPAEKIPEIVLTTVSVFTKTATLGWLIAFMVIIFSFFARVLRSKKHNSEVAMLKNETSILKDRLQFNLDEIKRLTEARGKNQKK